MTDEVIAIRGQRHTVEDCITCGVIFTVPTVMRDQAYQEGGYFHCPNGHAQGWSKEKSEHEQLRRERDRLQQRLAEKDDEIKFQREQREATERRLSASKGQVTKFKNRVGHGVCPCCNRSFENLARHMGTKHPTFAAEAAE